MRATKLAKKQQEKIEMRQKKDSEQGRKKRGRKPKLPEEVKNKEAKGNITDPESRIMKTQAGYVQGYNAQAIVTGEQIIVAAELTQEENDVNKLHPMLNKEKENVRGIGIERRLRVGLADAGYWSEGNTEKGFPGELELFVATKKDWKQRKALREQRAQRGRIPEGLSKRDRTRPDESVRTGGTEVINKAWETAI